jgi:hypothetical protein
VHFVPKVCEHFWNQRKILDFLIPILAYLNEKNFGTYLVDFLLFGDQKCHFRNKLLNIQKNVFNKLILDFCSGSKSSRKRSQGKNRLPLPYNIRTRTVTCLNCMQIFTKSLHTLKNSEITLWESGGVFGESEVEPEPHSPHVFCITKWRMRSVHRVSFFTLLYKFKLQCQNHIYSTT